MPQTVSGPLPSVPSQAPAFGVGGQNGKSSLDADQRGFTRIEQNADGRWFDRMSPYSEFWLYPRQSVFIRV